jgi:hypothetical protein
VRVPCATGLELERDYRFGVVRQLLEPVVYALDDAVRAQVFGGAAALAERLLTGQAAETGSPPPGVYFAPLHSLYSVLVGLTDLTPVAVVVDDRYEPRRRWMGRCTRATPQPRRRLSSTS